VKTLLELEIEKSEAQANLIQSLEEKIEILNKYIALLESKVNV